MWRSADTQCGCVLFYLQWVLPGEEMDNLEAVLDDPDGHQLLAVVAAVHHQAVDQTLDNWTLK